MVLLTVRDTIVYSIILIFVFRMINVISNGVEVTVYNWWVVYGLGFYAATRFACAGAIKLFRRLRPKFIILVTI